MAWELDQFETSLNPLSAATRVAYRSDCDRFVAWAVANGLDEPAMVARNDVRSFLVSLSQSGASSRTMRRRLAGVRRYFAWLREAGRVQDDPTAGLSAPRTAGRLPRVLRADEVLRLAEGADAPAIDSDDLAFVARELRDRLIVELLYGSGLRVSELCGLGLDDVHMAEGVIEVWGKGGRRRRVPISRPAAELLQVFWARLLGAPSGTSASERPQPRRRRRALGRPNRCGCSRTCVDMRSVRAMCGESSTGGPRWRCILTPFVTPLRLISWTAEPI